jgi:hypothetical protein
MKMTNEQQLRRSVEKEAKDFESFVDTKLSRLERYYLRLCIGQAYTQARLDAIQEFRREQA